MSPTFAPDRASAAAKFTATVDLPTPPFPEATAIICLTSESTGFGGSGVGPGAVFCLETLMPT